ncbi:ANTAR domain-containing protein [Streptomyces europaeiscabiei]|uniref:ANTAR domain-containing protein n=1 Tax=Streptomyces europaeiscabiei TaxID=146819 RepID=UPI0029A5CA39|nr:ANTAR domain-containing protein [Streptomyces europaeiscabiei]MDX2764746.1 ANTAR domain-containing protein [Streptomyces europaeiscabiei]
MTTSREQRTVGDGTQDATVARLEQENAQLRRAVDSHATVDQAIGVLVAAHRLSPSAGFEVLREVSQHTNIKLHAVAETLIGWALGRPLPGPVGLELDAAVQRRPHRGQTPVAS